eukprot:6214025-Pleurochrysis_carterae.AAC.11
MGVRSQRAWPGMAASSPWFSSSALAWIAQVSLRSFSTIAPSAPSARERICVKNFSLSPLSLAQAEAPSSMMACAQPAGSKPYLSAARSSVSARFCAKLPRRSEAANKSFATGAPCSKIPRETRIMSISLPLLPASAPIAK